MAGLLSIALLSLWFSSAAVRLKEATSSFGRDEWCNEAQKNYGIMPGSSWGLLTSNGEKEEWNKRGCDKLVSLSPGAAWLAKESWCGQAKAGSKDSKQGSANDLYLGLASEGMKSKWDYFHCDELLPSAMSLMRTDQFQTWCDQEADSKGIVPGHTWGTLTTGFERTKWEDLGCDNLVAVYLGAKAKESSRIREMWCQEKSASHGVIPGKSWGSLPDADKSKWGQSACDMLVLKARAAKATKWCQETAESYHVMPGTSWGSISDADKSQWQKSSCNDYVSSTPKQWCLRATRWYSIIPGKAWGSMSSDRDRSKWNHLGCNVILSKGLHA